MIRTRNILIVFLALLGCGVALAADKAELKSRFEKRYPTILQYKSDGKVGETTVGLLEAVDPKYLDDPKLSQLIDDENTDRHALHQLIAKDEGVPVEKVAERMARRNYSNARPGDYLKTADGKWKQK